MEMLHVKMFGNFSVTYEGKSLLGKKISETQFSYLMMVLLHNREEGVSREYLEEILFRDRDLENVHHTMQSVIYNTKKKLEKLGLPKTKYITLQKGKYCWTKDIPVIEDAEEFDKLYQEAQEETDEDVKIQLLMDACHTYTGEFLENYAGILWVSAEARKYRTAFYRCVEEAAELLRKRGDYMQLQELGRYATSVAPFSDWESLTMEAMIELGQYEEASELYAQTVDTYFKERGLRPSQKLMDSLNHLGDRLVHSHETLDNIQKELEETADEGGGYLCSYPIFQGIYHMLARMMERGGQSVYLMLCTIVDSKGNPMRSGEHLEELSTRLGDAICKSVRRGDVINRYSKGQYLVLLVNTTRESCAVIQKRINYNFLIGRQRTGIQYYVNSVVKEHML
ncbi:BTAD domain-containing putative transcriptional regulator [Roseburia hominis]